MADRLLQYEDLLLKRFVDPVTANYFDSLLFNDGTYMGMSVSRILLFRYVDPFFVLSSGYNYNYTSWLWICDSSNDLRKGIVGSVCFCWNTAGFGYYF